MKAAGILAFVLGICVAISAAGKLSPGKELDLTSGFQKAESKKLAADAETARDSATAVTSEADKLHAMGEVFEQTATRIDTGKTVSEISNTETQKMLLRLAVEHREQASSKRKLAATELDHAESLSTKAADLAEKQAVNRKAAREAGSFSSSLPGFGGGIVLCAVGLILWWKTTLDERSEARAALDSGEGSILGPVQLVAQIQQPLRDLVADIESLDGPGLCQRVEALNDGFVAPLADGRQRFVDRFGLAGGSEALNETAFGERMLNRVWSAAADGHLEEARSSFGEAVEAFAQAEQTVARLTAAT
jgi:hypothetical protein